MPTANNKDVKKVFNTLSAKMQIILNEAQKDIQSIEKIEQGDPLLKYKIYLILFLYKGIEISQSVLAILKHDLTLWRTAYASLRSLLELYINARLMTKDPTKLAERFRRFDYVRRYRFKKNISNLGENIKKMLDKKHKERVKLEDEYKKFKKDYNPVRINSWHGLSYKELLDAIKEQSEDIIVYFVIHHLQSRDLHNETASLEEYLRETDHGNIVIRRTVTPEDIDRTLVTGLGLFAGIYSIFSDTFKLKRDKWIKNFMTSLPSL